jgi:hypothetical protein
MRSLVVAVCFPAKIGTTSKLFAGACLSPQFLYYCNPRMNSKSLIFTIVAICLIGVAVGARCTKSTCTGPVFAFFDGFDCQGAPTGYSEVTNASMVGRCSPNDATSLIATCDGSVLSYQVFADSSCTQFDFSQDAVVGSCINNLGENSSQIALCGVNDTYSASLQRPNTSLPIVSTGTRACSSGDSCTEPIFTITYSNASGTCGTADIFSAKQTELGSNFTFGNCLYDENTNNNIKITCTETDQILEMYQSTVGCTGSPVYKITYSLECIADYKRNCVLPPAAPTDSSPTDTPSSSGFPSSSPAPIGGDDPMPPEMSSQPTPSSQGISVFSNPILGMFVALVVAIFL